MHLTPLALGRGLTILGLAGAFASAALAQDSYPSKPIRLLLGYAPGGDSDMVARLIAKPLGERLGQSVVVDNKPGAGGNIAADMAAKAPADGYTLVLLPSGHSSNAAMKKQDKTLRAAQVEYYKDRNFMETVGSWGELAMDDGSVLTAGYINYDGRVGYAIAENNVQIVSNARNLTAAADKATYDTNNQGTIELTGNATATQNGNTISGNQLRIINENNTSEASGNVKMVYIPKDKPAANNG